MERTGLPLLKRPGCGDAEFQYAHESSLLGGTGV
jgi:hypothetical protein